MVRTLAGKAKPRGPGVKKQDFLYRQRRDTPSGKQGDVLTVAFTVMGIPFGLNGGPAFTQSEAFSFQVATTDQAETDCTWNAIVGNGGQESACGWCKDIWGVSWQITPVVLACHDVRSTVWQQGEIDECSQT